MECIIALNTKIFKGIIDSMKLKLPALVLSVGQACNLRCKNCANFAPHALPEMRKYPVESIIADFETLFKVVDIGLLQIQGGEPLVYKDLNKLLGYLSACREITQIVIATNGIKTPNDETMMLCRMHKIPFRISNYPQQRDNTQNFATKCKNFKVDVFWYDFASNQTLWYDCGGLDVPREDDDEVVAERFNHCAFRGCLTLEDGELHRCSRAKNAYKMQGIELEEGDYVRVRNNENLLEDIISYHTPLRFENACRYCNGTDGVKMIPAAEQLD